MANMITQQSKISKISKIQVKVKIQVVFLAVMTKTAKRVCTDGANPLKL